MKLVLDSSIALKWVLPEPDSAKALQLRADFAAGIHDLVAPDVLPIECAHALTRAERRGIIPIGDAEPHLLNILLTGILLRPYQPLLHRALTISSAARIGVYDCLYVALAEQENGQLVTADVKLVKNLKAQFPFIIDLASVP
jgi:predicted nucleic acid-binding protein